MEHTNQIEVTPIASFQNFATRLGDFYDPSQPVPILQSPPHTTLRVVDKETQQCLFILCKKLLRPSLYEPIVTEYLPIVRKMESSNRGFAAGMKKRIQKDKFERSNSVRSAIAGFIDSPNNKYPCRLTKFSRDHFETYQKGLPMIRAVNKCLQEHLPEQYRAQLQKAEQTTFRIPETAFTTVTMNYNFQTAIHLDKGDCKEGFGTLVVCSKDIQGGHVIFPRYHIGVEVENGDVLLMNVHEYHCNTPIVQTQPDGYRLSFVCYLREKLLDCRHNEVLKELGIEDHKHWDTQLLVKKITDKAGMVYDNRVRREDGWELETSAYRMVCRKRQYQFYDKRVGKKITSLYQIWGYLQHLTI